MEDKRYQERAFRLKVLSTVMMKLCRHDIEKRISDVGVDINPLALAVLRFIKHEPSTICSISKKMMIAPASLVPVIDTLDNHGLIKKGSDPNDRRKNPLLITQKGADILSKVPMVAKDDLLAKSIIKMGDKKSSQMIKMMEELVTQLSGNDEICKRIEGIAAKEHGTKV